MARRGAMAKNPPLRGKARQEFKQAKREAVASGGEMPTQAQFRPKPQPRPQPQPKQPIAQMPSGAEQGAGQSGQQIQDYMYRYPQAGQASDAIGAATGAAMGNIAGSRSEGMRNPFEPQNNSYWFQGKPNMPGYMGMQAGNAAMPQPDFQTQAMPQMPQPSANQGGQYRLSPGVYGTKEQAMNQWAKQPAMPMLRKG